MNGPCLPLHKIIVGRAGKQSVFLVTVAILALTGLSEDDAQCGYLWRQAGENPRLSSPLEKARFMEEFGHQCLGNTSFKAHLADLYMQGGLINRAEYLVEDGLRKKPQAEELLGCQARLREQRARLAIVQTSATSEPRKEGAMLAAVPLRSLSALAEHWLARMVSPEVL